MEDLKSINPNTFWNGLLDENGSLLDVIDNKKHTSADGTSISLATSTNLIDRKPIRRRSTHQSQRIGHSIFNVLNLNENERIFIKSEPTKDSTSKVSAQTAQSTATTTTASRMIVDNSITSEASTSVKKELDVADVSESNTVPNSSHTMEIQIKDEPIDETNTSNADEQNLQIRQQIVPVIKTELGTNVPVVSNAAIQRPLSLQQTAHLQQQQHQHQTFTTNDQTLILSSRPIRHLTTNGPADGKAGKNPLFSPSILTHTRISLCLNSFGHIFSNYLTHISASKLEKKKNPNINIFQSILICITHA